MNKKLLISILTLSFLLSSCSSKGEVDISILKNNEIAAMSSVGVIFKVNLPSINDVTFNVSSTIGHINNKSRNEVDIVNENEEISWCSYVDEIIDNSTKLFYRYGFIEGLINKDNIIKGYFLLGIRNYEEDLSSFNYQYKVEIISTLYDESLSLDEIISRLNDDKSSYSSKF